MFPLHGRPGRWEETKSKGPKKLFQQGDWYYYDQRHDRNEPWKMSVDIPMWANVFKCIFEAFYV